MTIKGLGNENILTVNLPTAATSVMIPKEFMEEGTPYKYEVFAIEESGNQTLSSAEFRTK
ncbi:MAG: hypothetical protein GY795_02155 [Desulfobacterales bacterium]|nr:hypothetical protein [Desulfobacterales bacterium]